MPEYLSPGVYVEEVDAGPKPIEGAGTAMPAFVGYSEKAELKREVDGEVVVESLLNRPHLVTNWSQYVQCFGEFVPGTYMAHAVYGYFMNGGTRAYVVSVRTIPKAQAVLLNSQGKPQLVVRARQAGLDGGPMRVRIADVVPPAAPAAKKKGEEEGAAPAPAEGGDPSFTLFVEQGKAGGGWKVVEELKGVTLQQVEVAAKTEVRVAYRNNKAPKTVEFVVPESEVVLANLWPQAQEQMMSVDTKLLPSPTMQDFQGRVIERSGVEGLEALDGVTMVVVPDLMTTMPGEKLDLNMVKGVQSLMIAHCERMGDRVAIVDPPPNLLPQEIAKWRMDVAGYDSSYAALYWPWIQVMDPATSRPVMVPPSGHMAGVWAGTDATRGVHKAPANTVVQGAIGLAYQCTKGEQDMLNPIGVNCIRSFPGRGIRVWGARTLSSDPAWRYINVRRLFNYVESSIEGGTQWVVFEPNDRKLWARVSRDVTSFLKMVWRDGALFGSSPAEAFYVKCDDELNPPESRDLGRLVIEIGMAPVKPAEFVIFRISQWAGPGA